MALGLRRTLCRHYPPWGFPLPPGERSEAGLVLFAIAFIMIEFTRIHLCIIPFVGVTAIPVGRRVSTCEITPSPIYRYIHYHPVRFGLPAWAVPVPDGLLATLPAELTGLKASRKIYRPADTNGMGRTLSVTLTVSCRLWHGACRRPLRYETSRANFDERPDSSPRRCSLRKGGVRDLFRGSLDSNQTQP